MENHKKKQKKNYKTTDPNLFFQVKIKTIKDDLLLASLSGSELKVILAIASFINNQNKAYPSQKYLSNLTGLSVSTVSRHVSNLSSRKFLGEHILQKGRKRQKGSQFANNRYYLSTKVGINFGSSSEHSDVQTSIKRNLHTNNTNTLNENQLLKNNNKVISSKKKKEDTTSKFIQMHKLFTREEEDTILFYARIISEDKPFEGDVEFARRTFKKNIKMMGYENWKDLTKILQTHPAPKSVLNHIRYCVSQKEMTYEEAWKEWNSQC